MQGRPSLFHIPSKLSTQKISVRAPLDIKTVSPMGYSKPASKALLNFYLVIEYVFARTLRERIVQRCDPFDRSHSYHIRSNTFHHGDQLQ